jgi:hypothetical protein
MKSLFGSTFLCAALLLSPIGCDSDDGDSGDEGSDKTSSGEEGSGEEAAVGCMDGDVAVAVGETRDCECDDGSASTQTCLSTGEFGVCSCEGW